MISAKVYEEGEVAYMADELGVHRISNPDGGRVAVSLHREFSSFVPFSRDLDLMGLI